MDAATLVLLAFAGLFAGFVDSIVGGGGVITLPALLASGLPPHTAVATNKVAGTGASSVATWQYARAGLIDRRLSWWTFPLAFGTAVLGAATVLRLPGALILGLVAVVVVAMVAYVLLRPSFGQDDHFQGVTDRTLLGTAALALAVGYYDGVLGPGTGTLLLFGLIATHGFSFLRAAAQGRLLNFASNAGALLYFILVGAIAWAPGLAMAAGTMVGGFLGARSGIRHGVKWIRPLFVVVAVVLLVRILVT